MDDEVVAGGVPKIDDGLAPDKVVEEAFPKNEEMDEAGVTVTDCCCSELERKGSERNSDSSSSTIPTISKTSSSPSSFICLINILLKCLFTLKT